MDYWPIRCVQCICVYLMGLCRPSIAQDVSHFGLVITPSKPLRPFMSHELSKNIERVVQCIPLAVATVLHSWLLVAYRAFVIHMGRHQSD
jgi:hypothetical protein